MNGNGLVNNSGLEPLGQAVLVETYTPEQRKTTLVIPDSVKESGVTVETRAIVVAVGPEAWAKEAGPRAAPGDKVLISKFSGYVGRGTKDGKLYRFVNDRDIFAKIVEESEHAGQ